jgi:hypothetical protein
MGQQLYTVQEAILRAALQLTRPYLGPWFNFSMPISGDVIRTGDGKLRFLKPNPMEGAIVEAPGYLTGTTGSITRSYYSDRSEVIMPFEQATSGTRIDWSRSSAGRGRKERATIIGQLARAAAIALDVGLWERFTRMVSNVYPANGSALALSTIADDYAVIDDITRARRRFGFPKDRSESSIPWAWVPSAVGAKLVTMPEFAVYNVTGVPAGPASPALTQGTLPMRGGVNWWINEDDRRSHTAGTASGSVLSSTTTVTAGTSVVSFSGAGAAETLFAGDRIRFPAAGATEWYVVAHPDEGKFGAAHTYTADGTGAFAGVRLHPPARVDLVPQAVEQLGDADFILVHCKSAYMRASIPLVAEDILGDGVRLITATDTGSAEQPGTGASMTVVLGTDQDTAQDVIDIRSGFGVGLRQYEYTYLVKVDLGA